jgi:hypothetical protein
VLRKTVAAAVLYFPPSSFARSIELNAVGIADSRIITFAVSPVTKGKIKSRKKDIVGPSISLSPTRRETSLI